MTMSVITITYFSRKPVALGFAGLVCYHKEYAKNFMATDTFPSWVIFKRLSSSLNSPWVEFLILGTDSFSSVYKEFIFQTTERHVKLNCAVSRQLTQTSRYVMNIVTAKTYFIFSSTWNFWKSLAIIKIIWWSR